MHNHPGHFSSTWSVYKARHECRVAKCPFEEVADISKVLQPSSCAKTAWHSIFTIAIFSVHSACLFVFILLVLQGIDCALLATQTPYFTPLSLALCLHFVVTNMY